MRLLVTGFNPFGGEDINPSYEAVKLLPDQIFVDNVVGSVSVIKLEIPTEFGTSMDVIRAAIKQHNPDYVICVGQAGGRAGITPERVAINVDDASIPDNKGYTPCDEPVVEGAPAAYFATLPVKRIVEAIRVQGLKASVSNTAGTFVCNHVMYGSLHEAAKARTGAKTAALNESSPSTTLSATPTDSAPSPFKTGFIHVPFCHEQVSQGYPWWNPINWIYRPPSMSIEEISKGLEIALRVIAEGKDDEKLTGGAIC